MEVATLAWWALGGLGGCNRHEASLFEAQEGPEGEDPRPGAREAWSPYQPFASWQIFWSSGMRAVRMDGVEH